MAKHKPREENPSASDQLSGDHGAYDLWDRPDLRIVEALPADLRSAWHSLKEALETVQEFVATVAAKGGGLCRDEAQQWLDRLWACNDSAGDAVTHVRRALQRVGRRIEWPGFRPKREVDLAIEIAWLAPRAAMMLGDLDGEQPPQSLDESIEPKLQVFHGQMLALLALSKSHFDVLISEVEDCIFTAADLGTGRQAPLPPPSINSPTIPQPPIRPKRLTIDVERQTATLDGQSYDVPSSTALRWLQVLVDHEGEWLSPTAITTHDAMASGRTRQLRAFLPAEIDDLIETRTGAGTRIRLRK